MFPSTEELFIYTPAEFKELLDTIVGYNDGLIEDFLKADSSGYDRDFADLFKLQVKSTFGCILFLLSGVSCFAESPGSE